MRSEMPRYIFALKEVETRYAQSSLQMMPRMEESDANARSRFASEGTGTDR